MDITKDWLYDPSRAEDMPCRWIFNIHNCQESTFYQVAYLVTIPFAGIGLVFALFVMSCMPSRPDAQWQVWRWGTSRIFCFHYVLTHASILVDAIVKLVNPHTSYGLRGFLYSITFVGILPFVEGYCAKMISTAGFVSESRLRAIRSRFLSQACLRMCTPFVLLSMLSLTLAGVSLDHGWKEAYLALYIAFHACLGLSSLLLVMGFLIYGTGLCDHLSDTLDIAEQASTPSTPSACDRKMHMFGAARASVMRMRVVNTSSVSIYTFTFLASVMLAATPIVTFTCPGYGKFAFIIVRCVLVLVSISINALFYYYERRIAQTDVYTEIQLYLPRRSSEDGFKTDVRKAESLSDSLSATTASSDLSTPERRSEARP